MMQSATNGFVLPGSFMLYNRSPMLRVGPALVPEEVANLLECGHTTNIQACTCTSQHLIMGGARSKIISMRTENMLRALAEPNRQAILRLVRDKPRSVGEIHAHFDISQQAVSQHLQVLAEAGLVDVESNGRRRLYVINTKSLETLDRFLANLWPSGLRRLKRAVESGHGD